MALGKTRVCPLCGKTVDVRGFALHLKNAHGLEKAERDKVIATASEPSPEEQALGLVDRLAVVQTRLETLWTLRGMVPEAAFHAAESSARADFLAILDDLQVLFGVDGEDRESGEDWLSVATSYLDERQPRLDRIAHLLTGQLSSLGGSSRSR